MAKKPSSTRKMSVYANLSHARKTKKDLAARKKAEYLASLPKHPIKRTLYRLHPKRVAGYWFSKKGLFMALKIVGGGVLLLVLMIGGLFAYYRKDLDAIRPGELANRVQTTVTKYYDRRGPAGGDAALLWEDKGSDNYSIVVESGQINDYMKQATVSVEDKDFYNHHGVSVSGTIRSVVNNLKGGSVQGGSTLTQQLVKQVFFPGDASSDRSFGGVPRKIKEAILAIEVERMYDKDQILTLYLNESPYGGRRNGVESAAQTYFGKSAKDLTLPEAALLAAIPQNPAVYNPYNTAGNEGLITRQHLVLDDMAGQGYITTQQAEDAKKVAILDTIKPEASQYTGMKAPHFVLMVKSQLENELGIATVAKGGLTITTTLDLNVQNKLDEAMNDMFTSSIQKSAGFDNGAATVEDSQTGQIIALAGSRDYNYPGYGAVNSATAYIQPGSSIKPLVFSELFQKKPDGQANYGSGSILPDVNIDKLYGAPLMNADRKFKGNIKIRDSLATSRNIPAVEAMSISGVQPTIDAIHQMGGSSYCTQGSDTQVGLAAAIGGCGIRQVDLTNAYASLARGGLYKPQSSVLEVKNSGGQVLKKWADAGGTQIIDPQSAYIVSDILTDERARIPLDGWRPVGMYIPGVQTASKTGTSDKGGQAKDIWMASYSPALTMTVWLGNHDTQTLRNGTSLIPGPIIAKVMEYAHKDVYAPEGKWKSGDWFTQPAGIQKINGELYPSWYNKSQGQTSLKMTFDTVSKKKATDCTPDAAKITLDVTKSTSPITKKDIVVAPDGYDADADDNVHSCSDARPTVNTISVSPGSGGSSQITVNVTKGSNDLSNLAIAVDGNTVQTISVSGSGSYSVNYTFTTSGTKQISATVKDAALYTGTATTSYNAH